MFTNTFFLDIRNLKTTNKHWHSISDRHHRPRHKEVVPWRGFSPVGVVSPEHFPLFHGPSMIQQRNFTIYLGHHGR